MKKKMLLFLGFITLVGLFPLMVKGQEEIATGPASIEVYYPVAEMHPLQRCLAVMLLHSKRIILQSL